MRDAQPPTTPIRGSGEPWPWCQSLMQPALAPALETPQPTFRFPRIPPTWACLWVSEALPSEAIASHSPKLYWALHLYGRPYQQWQACFLYPRHLTAVSLAESWEQKKS